MSYISIGRDNAGNTLVYMGDNRGENIAPGVSVVGDAILKVGNTGASSNETMYSIANADEDSRLNVDITNASYNWAIYGTNMNVDVVDNNNEFNLAWNASNSNLSLESTSKGGYLSTNQGSSNNIFNLGYGNVSILDEGFFNTYYQSDGDMNFYGTSNSWGAVVVGGNGASVVTTEGNYGVFVGGNGYSEYNIISDFNPATDAMVGNGFQNYVEAGANSVVNDYGVNTLMASRYENSIFNLGGVSSLLYASGLNTGAVTILESAIRTYIFNGTTDKTVNGLEYKLSTLLQQNGWCDTQDNGTNGVTDDAYMGENGANVRGQSTEDLVDSITYWARMLGNLG